MDKILKRSEKIAFCKVGETYRRMRGFTDFSMSKNPTEYSRKYVDEESERNDVVGYNPTISFAFDRFSDDTVHAEYAFGGCGERAAARFLRYSRRRGQRQRHLHIFGQP